MAQYHRNGKKRSRQQSNRQGSQHHQPSDNTYRFLNPYNFVRPLEIEEGKQDREPLLGRCVPPPHDRYVGWTGSITCELTAQTPLFVSDSHNVQSDDTKDHYHYRFFRDPEGNIALPGTSLRGMLRSIFEAATNSCFSVFDDRRLSYHLESRKASWLVPARVECVRKEGDEEESQWFLHLLTGTSELTIEKPPRTQYAAWLLRYWPLKASKTLTNDPSSPQVRVNEQALQRMANFQKRTKRAERGDRDIQGMQHGEECFALLEDYQHPHPNIRFWDTLRVSKERSDLPERPRSNQKVVQGWLCLNNQNIEAKHSERFFFRCPDNMSGPERIELPKHVRQFYKELIEDYQKRHAEKIRQRKNPEKPNDSDPAYSRFIVHKEAADLADGHLVYAMLDGTVEQPSVKFIVPVSVPRVGYSCTIGNLLYPPELKKCHEYDKLCPACRVFGWVGDDQTHEDGNKRIAYAGRVRISHAHLEKSAGSFDTPVPLSILSTPKPTTTAFYLLDQAGNPDYNVDYNTDNAKLRGRKVYRHHGERLNEQEYKRPAGKKDNQNRTVHDVQKLGACFTFTVQFENLADIELGALLWSLEMEGWHHRLGLGKPLGFGSVTIRISDLKIMEPQQRYCFPSVETSGWADAKERKESWIKMFKEAMKARYGKDFDKLDNIRDLKALLADTPVHPVHYPRSTETPSPEGKNYEWFVQNKRRQHISLRLAEQEDDKDLPLVRNR